MTDARQAIQGMRVSEIVVPDQHRELDALLSADYTPPDRDDPVEVARRRRRRRNRLIGGGVVLLLIGAAVGTYTPMVLTAPIDASAPVLSEPAVTVPEAHAFAVPRAAASAISITGAEEFPQTLGTDGIIALNGPNDPQPMASLNKVITALVILDAKPLGEADAGPTITFTKADDDLYDKYYLAGATIQSMKAGATMSQRDALSLMMLVSASNYAEATATWAFGSSAGYVRAANRWLDANGLASTTVVEPTGVDPRNTSTPSDLIAIGRLAMANPALASIVKSKTVTVAPLGTLTNTNPALGADGINGIKTGTLEESGANLLFSATLDVGLDAPLTVIGIILGSPEQYVAGLDARSVLASIRDGFHPVKVVGAGSVFAEYMTEWDDTARAIAVDNASLLTWSDMPITSAVTVEPVTTAKRGTIVGSVTYTAGVRTVTVPLRLDDALNGPGGWWRLGHPDYLLDW